ncbi:MAG TPA: sodium:solute symporter, partial [Anaerovoracaceae bacterium]|nr:sodium:solute symporter [Anaerovoracaceae bacterium]
VISIISIIFVVLGSKGGFMAAVVELSNVSSETVPHFKGAFTSFFGPEPLTLFAIMILTSLGTWGLPQMIHKFYTIKNEKAIQTGTIISTVFALIIAGGSYFLGSFGRIFYTPSSDGTVAFDNIVPEMLGAVLPDILIGLVIIMVLSASMSTLSSLVIASSSTFTLDFLKGTVLKNISSRAQVAIIKVLCVLFVALSVIIAMNPNNLITTLMGLSWGTLAGAFLGPFLYGLLWKRANKFALWASIIMSLSINVVNLILGVTAAPVAGAVAILLSLVIVPLVSLVSPRQDKDQIDRIFSCYDEKIEMTVEHKFHLKEDEDNGKNGIR